MEYYQGFLNEEETPDILIDLESSVEEIEARAERTRKQIMAEAKSKVLVPGDFVIQAKESGKNKNQAKSRAKKDQKNTYIHVDVKKMDQLMDLMQKLFHSQSLLLESPDLQVPELSLENFQESAAKMLQISADLQNVMMSIRKVSLAGTFQKMNRLVFDISQKLGKDIEFVMVGENIEVDKNIIEYISDALMHLIRNAADHGIEGPEERRCMGKYERSRIILSAKQEAKEVRITVEDNGRGLDRDRIMDRAQSRG